MSYIPEDDEENDSGNHMMPTISEAILNVFMISLGNFGDIWDALAATNHQTIGEVKTLYKGTSNHVGARHRRKPLGRRKGFNIFINAAFTKIRAFVCGQVLSNYFYYYMSYQKLGFCMRCTNFVQIFQLLRIYQK